MHVYVHYSLTALDIHVDAENALKCSTTDVSIIINVFTIAEPRRIVSLGGHASRLCSLLFFVCGTLYILLML